MAEPADTAGMAELKELVSKTLETKGVLAKIRAQLRASVFTAIDEHQKNTHVHLESPHLKRMQATPASRLLLELLAEFFEFHELEYTHSVFVTEAQPGVARGKRQELVEKLELDPRKEEPRNPVLLEMLMAFQAMRQDGVAPRAEVAAKPAAKPKAQEQQKQPPAPQAARRGVAAPAGSKGGGAGLSTRLSLLDDLDDSDDMASPSNKGMAKSESSYDDDFDDEIEEDIEEDVLSAKDSSLSGVLTSDHSASEYSFDGFEHEEDVIDV